LYTLVFPKTVEHSIVLLSQGKIKKASEIVTRLYRNNPSSPIIQIVYARIATDGVHAKNIYTKVIQNRLSSDSLRAEALFQLGCFYYSRKEYGLADSMFSEAGKKYTIDKIFHMSALSSFNRKNSKKFLSISNTDTIKYTLQVGAFSTLLNAKKMFIAMEKMYNNVSIKKETVRGAVYHKVRVETFSSKDEARNYGEKYLRNKNIQFTVVSQ
jgi:tetratricopeptide (TPR) repeat protein